MKKLTFVFFALAFLFCACNKEGVYTPKKKIATVYYQGDGNEQKEVFEEYFWNGDLLKCKLFHGPVVDLYNDELELVPTYEGKRIVRVDEKRSGEYVEYFYDGKFLTKLICHNDNMVSEVTVEHQNRKISKIHFSPDKSMDKTSMAKFLRMFVSQSEIQAISKAMQSSTKTMGVSSANLIYSWDKDNVSECIFEMYQDDNIVMRRTYKYQYDNKLNPYAINWADLGSEFQVLMNAGYGRMLSMSKNNITKINLEENFYITPDDIINQVFIDNITYEYKGKYPIKASHNQHYEGEDTYNDIYYYEYK